MFAKNLIRSLLALALLVGGLSLAGCGSGPAGPPPTDPSGTNPDLLKSYPAAKGAKPPG